MDDMALYVLGYHAGKKKGGSGGIDLIENLISKSVPLVDFQIADNCHWEIRLGASVFPPRHVYTPSGNGYAPLYIYMVKKFVSILYLDGKILACDFGGSVDSGTGWPMEYYYDYSTHKKYTSKDYLLSSAATLGKVLMSNSGNNYLRFTNFNGSYTSVEQQCSDDWTVISETEWPSAFYYNYFYDPTDYMENGVNRCLSEYSGDILSQKMLEYQMIVKNYQTGG